MSKQMKVIMENWRKSILSEQNRILTVGELRNSISQAMKAKKGEVQKDAIKDFGAGLILDLIPGAASLKNAFDLAKTLYKLPDEKRTNTGLDYLNVDDEISAVVDDRIENQFLNDILNVLKDMDDTAELEDIDMTTRLSNYIADKFNNTKVEKG
jgi:hypothetical protein